MNEQRKRKVVALLRREIQEYKNSFVYTPLVVAGVLLFFMLVSVVVAKQITVVGDSIMETLSDKHAGAGMNITISFDDEGVKRDYRVRDETTAHDPNAEEWNFSREWTFNPERREKSLHEMHEDIESLNPVLDVLHGLFLLLLLVTSVNYLLGTFHHDRRDRSILFWKSMPVSEWQEVGAKMTTVCIIAPVIYLAASLGTQVASALLGMVLAWRMDMDPSQVVLGNIDFIALLRGQVAGMLIWVLWAAPFYAWLLLSSSVARRSPLLLAVGVPLALIVLEQLFIGSAHLSTAFGNHIPHPGEESADSLGFYFREPRLMSLDYVGMLLGLLVTAGLLLATVWFRKHRFEL